MTEKYSEDKKQLFNLMKKEAFFRERIVLSSGKVSDYYLDARRVTLSSAGAYLSARVICQIIKDESFVALGGPTLGADPMLGAINVICHQNDRPIKTFIIRKAPKAHGKQQQVEGPLIPEGAEVILIDDVATTGKAFLESIEVLRRSNIKVKKAICLVDRQEGAKEALAKEGCPLVAVFTAQEFLNAS
jgi:orotate phosphoribosyltransferase